MFPLNTAGRIGLNVALLLAGVVTLYFGRPVIVPLLIALLLASMLGPAAMWLHTKLRFPWGIACMSVVVGLVLANMLVVVVFSASAVRLANQLSNPEEIKNRYNQFRDKLQKYSPGELDPDLFPDQPKTVDEIGVVKWLRDATPTILQEAWKYTSLWSTQTIIILFVTFFLLLEGGLLARRAVAIFGPGPEIQGKAREVLVEMANQVRNYLVWRTLINLILALVMWAVYQVAGLNQGGTWAILLAILNYVPYLGPVLACIPPFLDAFIFLDPMTAVVITIIFWIVITIEGYLIVPMVMGRNMDLNATTVMVACLFWDAVWGPTGLFLAMPIMAGVKAILNNVPEWRPWANLMSTSDEKPTTGTFEDTILGDELARNAAAGGARVEQPVAAEKQ
jgi:AI-2 transport protein TqsA